MALFTLKQMAEIIGEADHRAADGIGYLHQQFRNLHGKGLIAETNRIGRGRTSSVVFNEIELCKVRLLSVLIDFGFDVWLLRKAINRMSPPANYTEVAGRDAAGNAIETLRWDDPREERFRLANLPSAILDGERWTFRLELINTIDGSKSVSGCFLIEGQEQSSPEEEKAVADFHTSQGSSVQAVIRLDCAGLLAPILSANA